MSKITIGPANESLRDAAPGWLEDPEMNKLMGHRKGDDGVLDAKLAFASALKRENRSGLLGVYEDDKPVGYVLMTEPNPFRRTIRFQLFIAKDEQGRGLGDRALAQLAERVLLSTRVHRLETEILATNARGKAFLAGFGFTQEGFRKHSWWADGSPHSTVVMRLLAPDWRRLKKERKLKVEEVA